ncbi:ion transporter [Pseudomonas neustonica]|uniref:Ion transporter n=1 Tax=Pseudomonas neustonica TaxID=2487346 RepID=A0ABX9XF32_9PSED|nr:MULTISPECIES: ion transporter [Pseudomonas]ROZ81115.1 ion transporter [Pseudomonas sp. SSM44]ROZ82376.1 ion transporter [Pseudomonas neustonica]|tara:strand:- start:418 stop:1254 length:837 start_codon:yes stop_codon:yes gene_type:complete
MNDNFLNLASPWRQRLAEWLERASVQYLVTGLILINAVILGLETSSTAMQQWGHWLRTLDQLILACFVIEIALRFTAHGWRLLRDPWGLFDTLVIAIALIPASGPLAVLRALRVLRVLRLISLVPSMKMVVQSLLASLPGMGSIVALLGLVFYVAAVIATQLFGEQFPQWFGTLGDSLYTLFQVMTLESWSMGIVRPVMEEFPYAWLYFIPFILIATFMMLNLFIAVIVDAIQNQRDKVAEQEQEQAPPSESALLLEEVRQLRAELHILQQRLPPNEP